MSNLTSDAFGGALIRSFSVSGSPQFMVFVPLRFEAGVARAAVGRRGRVVCTGPGAAAIERAWTDEMTGDAFGAVILFGVAGGLAPCEIAPPIAQIVDRHGNAWKPTITMSAENGVSLLGVDSPALNPDEKRELHARFGAQLVDCESHAFARLASRTGVQWGICRGISDAFDESLPPECGEWISAQGGVRPVRVMMSVLRNPSQIGTLRRLRQGSRRALDAAVIQLRKQIEGLEQESYS